MKRRIATLALAGLLAAAPASAHTVGGRIKGYGPTMPCSSYKPQYLAAHWFDIGPEGLPTRTTGCTQINATAARVRTYHASGPGRGWHNTVIDYDSTGPDRGYTRFTVSHG